LIKKAYEGNADGFWEDLADEQISDAHYYDELMASVRSTINGYPMD
jgi:hypothetical protein